MVRLLLITLLLAVVTAVGATNVSAKNFWSNLLYPQGVTTPSHELTFQKVWGWGNGHQYNGFIVSTSDFEKFTRLHIEISSSETYEISRSTRNIKVPDGVSIKIKDLEFDFSGVTIGQLGVVKQEKVLNILPALSIPLYVLNTKHNLRDGLHLRLESRVGLGYEFRRVIESGIYEVHVIGEKETINIPYTDSRGEEGVSVMKVLTLNLGILHSEHQFVYSYPDMFRYNMGIGVRW